MVIRPQEIAVRPIEIQAPAHSEFGASKFHRILECVGSVRMSRGRPDSSNEAAEIGTAAHELAEWCLKTGLNAYECLGLTFNKRKVDLRMVEGVQLYVSYVRDLCRQLKVDPMLETRVIMTSVSNDVYGTADCLILVGDHLYVIDYKNGRVTVEASENPQAIFYGVAALDTFQLWGKVKHVTLGIVQPNGDHIGGQIRTAQLTTQDMLEWQKHILLTVNQAKARDAKTRAGTWCKHCPAAGTCRARIERTLSLVYTEKPRDEMNAEELEIVFLEISTIKNTLEKLEESVIGLARKGKAIEGYKLVNSIPRAKCEDEKGFVEAAKKHGVTQDKLYNKKLISMTDSKKLLPHKLVNAYFKKPPPSTTLVKSNSARAAVSTSSAVGKFTAIDQSNLIQESS